MGLIDFDLYSWKAGPQVFLYILVVILCFLFFSTILMTIGMAPFFFPGIIMMFLTLWIMIGTIHWIKKLEGYHYRLYRIKPEDCVGIVEKALKDLDLKWEDVKDKVDPIFFWTVNYDGILHIPKEGINVCFRFFKFGQATGVFLGKEGPSNIELIGRIKESIDEGSTPKNIEYEKS